MPESRGIIASSRISPAPPLVRGLDRVQRLDAVGGGGHLVAGRLWPPLRRQQDGLGVISDRSLVMPGPRSPLSRPLPEPFRSGRPCMAVGDTT